jgi:hypothetical protein
VDDDTQPLRRFAPFAHRHEIPDDRGASNARPAWRCRGDLTLAVVVLFIAGSAFAASQEARASAGALARRLALEAANTAPAVLRDWDPSWNITVPVGQTRRRSHTLSSGAASIVRLTRTIDHLVGGERRDRRWNARQARREAHRECCVPA